MNGADQRRRIEKRTYSEKDSYILHCINVTPIATSCLQL